MMIMMMIVMMIMVTMMTMMIMMTTIMMMMTMMMMMRCLSSLRVRAKPRHLPYIYLYAILIHTYDIHALRTGFHSKVGSF